MTDAGRSGETAGGAAGPPPGPGPALARWVVARRPPRSAGEPPADPERAHGAVVELERAADGRIVDSATILLTGRQCPWRCVMCDLWAGTLAHPTPAGAIPRQIRRALAEVGGAVPEQVKLYNAGSFFDRRAVPEADHAEIAALVGGAARVVVECHPRLVGEPARRFRDRLRAAGAPDAGPAARGGAAATAGPALEVALGLEIAHPEVLRRLGKGATLDDFARAAEWLAAADIALRCFVLVGPPFLPAAEAVIWAVRSVDFALSRGATAVSLIATRAGNGAMEALARSGVWPPPTLAALESALAEALIVARGRGRVFADTWALESLAGACPHCLPARRDRLHRMNLTQRLAAAVPCPRCPGPAG